MERSEIFMLLSSSTIAIPLIAGLGRLGSIPRTLYPFICFIILSSIIEFIGILTYISHSGRIHTYSSQIYSYFNIFFLIEAFVLTFQFVPLGIFSKRWQFPAVLVLYFAVWLIEHQFTKDHRYLSSYFVIIHSFMMVILSIKTINSPIVNSSRRILSNPVFIICGSFITYYTVSIVTETFSSYTFKTSLTFRWHLLNILNAVNILCNLFYAYAISYSAKRKMILNPEI